MSKNEDKEKAVQLLNICSEELFDKFSTNPVLYSSAFNNKVKQIAKKYNISEEYLWQRYVGVSPGQIEKKESKSKALKRQKEELVQRLKIVEMKTPRSSWWLAKKKANWRVLKYRVVMIPSSHFVYVRVPTFINRYEWLQKLRFPVKLLKSAYRQKLFEAIIDSSRKPSKLSVVVGDFWETEKDTTELDRIHKKQERLQGVIQEILKHRIDLMLDKVGERIGFNKVVVIDNLFTGKDYMEERWQCKKGNFCPCGTNKSCTILKEVSKLTSLEAR